MTLKCGEDGTCCGSPNGCKSMDRFELSDTLVFIGFVAWLIFLMVAIIHVEKIVSLFS